jgi:hypothetical protein
MAAVTVADPKAILAAPHLPRLGPDRNRAAEYRHFHQQLVADRVDADYLWGD